MQQDVKALNKEENVLGTLQKCFQNWIRKNESKKQNISSTFFGFCYAFACFKKWLLTNININQSGCYLSMFWKEKGKVFIPLEFKNFSKWRNRDGDDWDFFRCFLSKSVYYLGSNRLVVFGLKKFGFLLKFKTVIRIWFKLMQ